MGGAHARKLGDVVADYLLAQHAVLRAADTDLRDAFDAVHRTRVATRRFRSVLRVFAELFEPDPAEALDTELAWFAGLLGAARDAEVLRVHLADTFHSVGSAHITDTAIASVDEHLHAQQSAAATRVRAEMNGARYRALLDELTSWQRSPRFTAAADVPAERVVGYLDRARRTMDRRLARAVQPDAADDVLHRARKAAKRTRYAAELAVPVLGGAARRVVKRATAAQQVLGEHQDTVVARAVLAELGAPAGHEAFAYGMAYEREWLRAQEARHQLRRVVRR